MIRATAVLATTALGLTLAGAPAPAADLLLGGGQRIDGAAAGDDAARSTAPAGDVNGDGIDDMIIGAPDADYLSRDLSGAAYVVFGSATPAATIDLSALGSRGFVIGGSAAGDRAGTSVAGAEDVNGDGYDDVVVGAPDADFNLRGESGSVYVVFGGPSPADIDLATLGTRGARIDGAAAGDGLGRAVAGPGDVNGDGRFDILAGAPLAGGPGAAWVALAPFAGTLDLASPGGSAYRISGEPGGAATGAAVAGAGDLNADGRDDLLIGAPDASFNFRGFSGSTYVVYGLASPATVSLASLGGAGYRIDGAGSAHNSGAALGTGDINGDDRTDILIGARSTDYNSRNDSGSVYAIFAPGPVDLANLGSAGIRVDGGEPNALFGASVAALDLNGDSIDDLIGGAPSADVNSRPNSGATYVVFGGPAVASRDLGTTPADRFYDGAAAGHRAGASLSSLGDVNDDAGEDLGIGAPGAGNNGRAASGSAYVVFGDPIEPDPVVTPTPATLTVKARKASRAVPRTAKKVRLVKKVTVGPGQSARITVKVKPKRTKKKVKVLKKRTTVTVRARKAPKGRVTVWITASGTGYTPTTWKRTWRVR
jgi:hypothetical protein